MSGDVSRRSGVIVIVMLLAVVVTAAACSKPRVIEPEPPPPATADPVPPEAEQDPEEEGLPTAGPGEILHPLTGLPVKMELLERRPFLVSIDDHPRARPQYGLAQADLVYEVPVEGGVTRFAALFWAGEADQIGPVRSSRPYFLDLALEWQAAFVHAGGSPQHYAQIDQLPIPDIDDVRGAAGGGVFWRGDDRRAPHNLYTSSRRVQDKIRDRRWTLKPDLPDVWRFALPADLPPGEEAAGVAVRWPGAGSNPERFAYDEDSGLYTRYLGEDAQVDGQTGEPLRMRNVIIQFTGVRPISGDGEGRLEVDMVGSGRALVVSAGTVREARWRKVDRPSPTVFTEADGRPLTLVPGRTWILVVSSGAEVTPIP